jgi:hypothetical protein
MVMDAPASLKKLLEEKHVNDRPASKADEKMIDRAGYSGNKVSDARLNKLANLMADTLANMKPGTRYILETNGIAALEQNAKSGNEELRRTSAPALETVQRDINTSIEQALKTSGLFTANQYDALDVATKEADKAGMKKLISNDINELSADRKLTPAIFKEIDAQKAKEAKEKASRPPKFGSRDITPEALASLPTMTPDPHAGYRPPQTTLTPTPTGGGSPQQEISGPRFG